MAKRNNEQNALFHCHARTVSEHFFDMKMKISEVMVKEIVKKKLGNNVFIEEVQEWVAMPTSSYKMTERELTKYDHENDFISFDQLIEKMVVWASTDLSLVLVSPNEKDMVNHG